MQGEIRVTVIATGFDRARVAGDAVGAGAGTPSIGTGSASSKGQPVIPFPTHRQTRTGTVGGRSGSANAGNDLPRRAAPPERVADPDLSDMEIPTFIRRQMD
jgi:cell division protein FtsZ